MASVESNARRIAVTLLTSAILGLVGWIYHTSTAVAKMEVRQENTEDDIREIKEIVTLLHKALIGPIPERKPTPQKE